MNCNSVRDHLVDFLYEEMAADSRAAFEEHVRTCPSCTADVASYRLALGSVRTAFNSAIEEAPARVHNAVLEAAKTAAATRTAVAPRRGTREEPEPGFFTKLWRTPWLLPAFGAASVATVVFLVRVLKNPDVLPGQRSRSIGELSEPIAAPAARPMPAPASVPLPEESSADELLAAQAKARPAAGSLAAKAPRPTAKLKPSEADRATRDYLAHTPAKREARGESGVMQPDELELADKKSAPRYEKGKADRGFAEDLPPDRAANHGSGAGESRFAVPPPRMATKAAGNVGEIPPANFRSVDGRGPRSVDMDEPLGSASAQPAAAPSPAAPSPKPSRSFAAAPAPIDYQHAPESEAAPSRLSEHRRAAREPAERAAPSKPATVAYESDDVSTSYAERAPAKGAKEQAGYSLEESIRRADRLFADANWSAAAEAYRDLLRRFPGHKDSAKWRGRLDRAVVAAQEQTGPAEAKAAKAKRTDSDTGAKQ